MRAAIACTAASTPLAAPRRRSRRRAARALGKRALDVVAREPLPAAERRARAGRVEPTSSPWLARLISAVLARGSGRSSRWRRARRARSSCASARACARPSVVQRRCRTGPAIRSSRFQSVSPCRARRSVVIARYASRRWISDSQARRASSPARPAGSASRPRGCSSPRARASSRAAAATRRDRRDAARRRRPRPSRTRRRRVVEAAVEALGGLDVLVNNVGFAGRRSFEEVTDEDWDAMWQLNVMSYVRAIRAALPHCASAARRDRERLLDRGQAAVGRDAALLGHEGGGALAVAARRRPLRRTTASAATRSRPGPTATDAWLGEGGLADQQGDARRGAREGRRRAAARPARRAGGDRRRDRVPLLRAGVAT